MERSLFEWRIGEIGGADAAGIVGFGTMPLASGRSLPSPNPRAGGGQRRRTMQLFMVHPCSE
ncbi:hypothetical protein [Lysobacter sp. Root690]|uniref:hypothetical protein n=1 Tax=Lysobacter sp. Root690 TaxID=1736588 RepID=UPI0006FB1952|nr:hypothetical protein [Lysobacter sp. Root690]KRB08870.1 hypothetical protein ASD86_06180 [Lysobacter sp. Root690]